MYIDDDDVVRRFLDADRHADYADDDADDDEVVRRCLARC